MCIRDCPTSLHCARNGGFFIQFSLLIYLADRLVRRQHIFRIKDLVQPFLGKDIVF